MSAARHAGNPCMAWLSIRSFFEKFQGIPKFDGISSGLARLAAVDSYCLGRSTLSDPVAYLVGIL